MYNDETLLHINCVTGTGNFCFGQVNFAHDLSEGQVGLKSLCRALHVQERKIWLYWQHFIVKLQREIHQQPLSQCTPCPNEPRPPLPTYEPVLIIFIGLSWLSQRVTLVIPEFGNFIVIFTFLSPIFLHENVSLDSTQYSGIASASIIQFNLQMNGSRH